MPGLYTIATRAPGTLITALIYNFDHQAHVDGRAADFMQALGVSVGQFNLVEDPYPGSVESLAPSLAGEITRLRFVLKTIVQALKGGAASNWYDAITTPGFPTIGARVQRGGNQSIPNAAGTPISFVGGTADFNSGVWEGIINPTRFTAPVAGKYYAFAEVLWPATAGGRRQLQIGTNGAFTGLESAINNIPSSSTTQRQAVTGILNLAANDYVEFAAFQNSGGALNILQFEVQSVIGGIVYFGANP